jgi:hypothetical protein
MFLHKVLTLTSSLSYGLALHRPELDCNSDILRGISLAACIEFHMIHMTRVCVCVPPLSKRVGGQNLQSRRPRLHNIGRTSVADCVTIGPAYDRRRARQNTQTAGREAAAGEQPLRGDMHASQPGLQHRISSKARP